MAPYLISACIQLAAGHTKLRLYICRFIEKTHPKLRLEAGIDLLTPATLCCLAWQFLCVALPKIFEHSFSGQCKGTLTILVVSICASSGCKFIEPLFSWKFGGEAENAIVSECTGENGFGFEIRGLASTDVKGG